VRSVRERIIEDYHSSMGFFIVAVYVTSLLLIVSSYQLQHYRSRCILPYPSERHAIRLSSQPQFVYVSSSLLLYASNLNAHDNAGDPMVEDDSETLIGPQEDFFKAMEELLASTKAVEEPKANQPDMQRIQEMKEEAMRAFQMIQNQNRSSKAVKKENLLPKNVDISKPRENMFSFDEEALQAISNVSTNDVNVNRVLQKANEENSTTIFDKDIQKWGLNDLEDPGKLAEERLMKALDEEDIPSFDWETPETCPECSGAVADQELKTYGKCFTCMMQDLSKFPGQSITSRRIETKPEIAAATASLIGRPPSSVRAHEVAIDHTDSATVVAKESSSVKEPVWKRKSRSFVESTADNILPLRSVLSADDIDLDDEVVPKLADDEDDAEATTSEAVFRRPPDDYEDDYIEEDISVYELNQRVYQLEDQVQSLMQKLQVSDNAFRELASVSKPYFRLVIW
jgi:hypothetical protein